MYEYVRKVSKILFSYLIIYLLNILSILVSISIIDKYSGVLSLTSIYAFSGLSLIFSISSITLFIKLLKKRKIFKVRSVRSFIQNGKDLSTILMLFSTLFSQFADVTVIDKLNNVEFSTFILNWSMQSILFGVLALSFYFIYFFCYSFRE